jgi:hypothetical protein
MQKIKTYVIIISEKFPKTHFKAGQETDFELSIVISKKIHTIRHNYALWEKRIKEVQEGRAYLSVRKWTGKPYTSPQIELFRFDKDSGVGIEKLKSTLNGWVVNDLDSSHSVNEFAKNDGLSVDDFCEWFKGIKIDDDLAIIHFTPFRYIHNQ